MAIDVTMARLGAINNNVSTEALTDAMFLKVFGGETLAAFETANVALDKFLTRTIASGKSAEFPRFGKAAASYHQPGNDLGGRTFNAAPALIELDGLLVSDYFIPSIDELKTHYDLRSPIAAEMGRALANQMDRHILQTLLRAAKSANVVTGLAGGTVIKNTDVGGTANIATSSDDLVDAILLAHQTMDEKDVPDSDRVTFVKPTTYYRLIKNNRVVSVELNGGQGNGGVVSGKVYMVGGYPVIKTNQLPTTNVTAGTDAGDANARHAVDARNTVALIGHSSAIGTLKLLDLHTDTWEEKRKRGHMLLAEYAVGHGILRPEAAAQIKTVDAV